MSNRIKNNLKNLVGQTLNQYYSKVKPTISDLRYKQEYQNRIIECMVGEVDDNYITTPETDNPIVKLEYSKEGVVKIPSIKGKTILVDADGNETDTPGEGCRLVSVGEEEDNKLIILSNNKNLNSKVYFGAIYNGKFSSSDTRICSEYIRAYKGIKYVASIRHGGLDVFFFEIYDLEGNYITQIPATGNNYTPEFDCYFRCWRTRNGTDSWLQVEIDKQTSYVEPQSHKTEILLGEPLRSLPNGVCDEITGNKLIRRLREVTLRGDEAIGIFKEKDEHISFRFEYKNFPNSVQGSENLVLSNNFKWLVDFNRNEELINFAGAIVIITISKSKLETPDIEGFKKWLKLNPTSIIYPLKEPIIEELPNGITLQGFDDTTMYIENSITPTVQYGYNALIPYKQELLNQKEEVETNTLDIENNIIPYLMDMEFNLMLMEDN